MIYNELLFINTLLIVINYYYQLFIHCYKKLLEK